MTLENFFAWLQGNSVVIIYSPDREIPKNSEWNMLTRYKNFNRSVFFIFSNPKFFHGHKRLSRVTVHSILLGINLNSCLKMAWLKSLNNAKKKEIPKETESSGLSTQHVLSGVWQPKYSPRLNGKRLTIIKIHNESECMMTNALAMSV